MDVAFPIIVVSRQERRGLAMGVCLASHRACHRVHYLCIRLLQSPYNESPGL